ncbi:hypothetical protein ACHAW6_005441 [Cyclotella cf. meneghiniana]
MVTISSILPLLFLPFLRAFAPPILRHHQLIPPQASSAHHPSRHRRPLGAINDKRRKQLGIPDDQDEYDLGVALSTNTDAGITKIIAGSFILVMIALLVVGLVIPSLTDYGEGVCSPIQTGGRC